MACSAPSIVSSLPRASSSLAPPPPTRLSSHSLIVPRSFHGLRKSPFQPRSSRISPARSSRRSFVVNASQLPLVGNKAPDFDAEAVFDQEFINVKLSDYLGKKYVILFFYPLDFTFVCPTEITAFSDRYAEFEALNTEVLGVSVDSVFSHLAWVQTDRKSGGLGDLKYPLVSDVTKSISSAYNVLIPDQGIALRGLFIIDKEGIIQHSTINNLAIGRSVDETKRTLQPSVRKQHNAGYKHKANVRTYYQQFEEQQTQSLIDQRIKEHLGQAAAFQQVGATFHQHLAAQRPRLPILPTPMMPFPGMRPPVLPLPLPGAQGYGVVPTMPQVGMAPVVSSMPPHVNSLPMPPTSLPTAPATSLPASNNPSAMVNPGTYQIGVMPASGGVNNNLGQQLSAAGGPTTAAPTNSSQDGYSYSQTSEPGQ